MSIEWTKVSVHPRTAERTLITDGARINTGQFWTTGVDKIGTWIDQTQFDGEKAEGDQIIDTPTHWMSLGEMEVLLLSQLHKKNAGVNKDALLALEVQVTDDLALRQITRENLIAYVEANGWKFSDELNAHVQPGVDGSFHLAYTQKKGGFDAFRSRSLQEIAKHEGRSALLVWNDIVQGNG